MNLVRACAGRLPNSKKKKKA
uniref:Uncharacterized protein n=1 Tax=Anguilla anguilla TaxID=7936 RepID=A0A0E9Q6I8_ANGAN